jgi:hypothetical protein
MSSFSAISCQARAFLLAISAMVPEQWIGAASANSLQAMIATATTDRGLSGVFGETIR